MFHYIFAEKRVVGDDLKKHGAETMRVDMWHARLRGWTQRAIWKWRRNLPRLYARSLLTHRALKYREHRALRIGEDGEAPYVLH